MCPLCGKADCYREITAYWRYAVELFPDLARERIPVARFLCRNRRLTFSLLPIQLIPYHQYTAGAVLGTVLLGLDCFEAGRWGFGGACEAIHPDSLVTAWLVAWWLELLVRGFVRAHGTLCRFYSLSAVSTSHPGTARWHELKEYLSGLGWQPAIRWGPWIMELLRRYSGATGQFLFGTPSQHRI